MLAAPFFIPVTRISFDLTTSSMISAIQSHILRFQSLLRFIESSKGQLGRKTTFTI